MLFTVKSEGEFKVESKVQYSNSSVIRKVTLFGMLVSVGCLLAGNASAEILVAKEMKTKVECYLLLDGEPQTKKVVQIEVQPATEALEIHTMTTSYNTYSASAEISATAEMNSSEIRISAYVSYSLENQDSGAVKVSGLNELDVSMGSTQLRCAVADKL